MDVKLVFGGNLKYYRKIRRLSQEELSEKLDISSKHLSNIERGMNFASPALLGEIAQVLEVPLFLFFIQDQEIFLNDPSIKIFLDDSMLKSVGRVIEKRLAKTAKELKAEVYRIGGQIPGSLKGDGLEGKGSAG
jgi:transcriptional regulator with XRE-family HTH domain